MSDFPGFRELFEDLVEGKEATKNDRKYFQEIYDEIVVQIGNVLQGAPIYRQIEVPQNVEFPTETGIFWAWDKKSAHSYFRPQKRGDKIINMRASITNPASIDIWDTFSQNMYDPQVREIRLHPSSRVLLHEICDEKWEKCIKVERELPTGQYKLAW